MEMVVMNKPHCKNPAHTRLMVVHFDSSKIISIRFTRENRFDSTGLLTVKILALRPCVSCGD